jgi:phosphate starvation-inducible protein PhoH and related proteins
LSIVHLPLFAWSILPSPVREIEFSPDPFDNRTLANLCGPLDQNLREIEQRFDVRIVRRGEWLRVSGTHQEAESAANALRYLYQQAKEPLSVETIRLAIKAPQGHQELTETPKLQTRKSDLRGRTPRQNQYLQQILDHDLSFGVGPAGTGKTYLAVACAVDAIERGQVERIVLTRPAVEAGERLGFLPGDLSQKVDPYLRPLYDCLYELMGFERTIKLLERQMIEIAPLAYMRGRTLTNSFIILDEAQNTSTEQMKMFLTRLGFGSKAVVTGDPSQIDLPRGQTSGLIQALKILDNVKGIAFTHYTSDDVVRHPLVGRIVKAYEQHES